MDGQRSWGFLFTIVKRTMEMMSQIDDLVRHSFYAMQFLVLG